MPLDTRRIRLYAPQIQLIRPGLSDLVAEYNHVCAHGRLRVLRLTQDCLPAPVNLPSAADVAAIVSALGKLNTKNGKTARLRVTTFELRAMILGVRLTERLIRLKRLSKWRWDQKKAAMRLIKTLESERLSSVGAFVEAHGQQTYGSAHQRWQETVKCIRRDLVTSKLVLLRGVVRARNGRRLMVKDAAVLAAEGLRLLGYRAPDDRVLRQILRERMMSKGGVRSALTNPDRISAGFDLAGFVLAKIPDMDRVARERRNDSRALSKRGRTTPTIKTRQPARPKVPAMVTVGHGKLATPPKADDSLVFLAELRAQTLRDRWESMKPLDRAQEVTEMLSYGASRRQIAKWLGVNDKTVRNMLRVSRLQPQHKQRLKRQASVRSVLREATDPFLQQRQRVERDRKTGEHSGAVSTALIAVLDQAADLFPGNRAEVARHFGRCALSIPGDKYKNVLPAWDIESALNASKPQRAASLDGPDAMNFYMAWLMRAIQALAPEPEIRERVAHAITAYKFGRPQAAFVAG